MALTHPRNFKVYVGNLSPWCLRRGYKYFPTLEAAKDFCEMVFEATSGEYVLSIEAAPCSAAIWNVYCKFKAA